MRSSRLPLVLLVAASACAPSGDPPSRVVSGDATATASQGSSATPPEAEPPAVTALRAAIRDHYSYRDRLGLDWKAAIDARAADLAKATDAASFAKIVAEILAPARDTHITIEVEGQPRRLVPHVVKPVLNFAQKTLERVITDWKVRTRCLITGTFEGYAYVMITHWERARCGDLGADFAAALSDAKSAKALILDMRANAGGDELLARAVAGRFVKKPTLYAKHVSVVASAPGTFGPVQERVLEPVAGGWDKPVVTLMGPVNMSSNEAFLLMMRAAGSRLVGQRSGGSSGNPQPHRLGHGVTVYLPSWKAMLPNGSVFEGVGIAPDVEVATVPADFETNDPVLRAAVAELAKR
jgi:C-terminal processing protease CtpA/Prc